MDKKLIYLYFLRAGKIEGWSFLILLFIAMPLKYFCNLPFYVKVFGMVHGILFVIFIVFIFLCVNEKILNVKNGFYAFLLSLLPFGTFFLKNLKAEK